MTPKSLLRSKASSSTIDELSNGQFQLVIDDPAEPDPENISRLVFCSGKIYYDLAEARDSGENTQVALVRVEQLYPFPADRVVEILGRYPAAKEVAWCQEEPQNQGAWYQIKHHIEACTGGNHDLYYTGRGGSASPAVGYYSVHIEQQKRLVAEALEPGKGQLTNKRNQQT
jgi:2-oxoglutarate dehydrogenase E1 component